MRAQDNVKQSVVRIENTKLRETGAGFIVKIVGDKVYVVTAAHVVRGDQNPLVYLFSEQTRAFSATVFDREEDDLKGLALLVFTANARPPGIVEFKLAATSDLGHGEGITFIGFPGTSLWSVDGGNVKRLEGRNLVLSGSARQGNSGGPVVLNQQAIGLVTDVSQSDVYAARAETIVLYVNGFISNLIKLTDPQKPGMDEFCEALKTLVEAGKDGFYAAIGEPLAPEQKIFYSNVRLSGTEGGYIRPRLEAYYVWLTDKDRAKVEKQFYQGVVKIKRCLQGWNEEEKGTSHKFKEPNGSVLVDLYYVTQDSESYLFISIYP